MNDLPPQDLPPDEQLREALNGFVAIFEALLRRNSDYGAAIEQFRSRQHAESERIAALERSMATDRAALERIRGVFADLARLSAPIAGGSEITVGARGDQQDPFGSASAPNGHISSPFPRQAPAGS